MAGSLIWILRTTIVAIAELVKRGRSDREGKRVAEAWGVRSTPGQGADRTKRYQTELLRHRKHSLSSKHAGQSLVRAFLDTEEVGGSNPPAPTTKRAGQGQFSA